MPDTATLADIDLAPSLAMAERLFADLAAATPGAQGITRAPYGPGEQIAHDMVADLARSWGLETRLDPVGNLTMTWPGEDRARPAWMVGSHLDTVPEGGNYDGAAGVLAGLVAAHALARSGRRLPMDLTVIAMRAEEASSWFAGRHRSHFGSRAMFGQLGRQEMQEAVARADGRPLIEVMRAAGFDPQAADSGVMLHDPARIAGFIELHIEQGPVLIEADLSVALITGICGNLRARAARVIGEHAHSGAVPRAYRKDAVLAGAEFAHRLETLWQGWLDAGHDCVCTLGIFATDPAQHALSKIPGHIDFTIDFRSLDPDVLKLARRGITALADEITARRGVRIDLGLFSSTAPVVLSDALIGAMQTTAQDIGMQTLRMASGGGHDAVSFAEAGIPAAMLFVRNQNGSHNPDEAMEMVDFAEGARLILAFLMGRT